MIRRHLHRAKAIAKSALELPGRASCLLILGMCAVPSLAATPGHANVRPQVLANACPLAATSNFDGLCRSDILWQNSGSSQVDIWLMNGTTIAGAGSPGNPGPGWSVVGVGDFNGDGKADLLWQNSTTNQLVIWQMSGTQISLTGSPGGPSSDWSVQGVGDFDGDGNADILWQNATSGDVVIWFMSGATIRQALDLGAVPGWTVTGVGDFNGDHMADILWQNQTTGADVIWLMNGTAGILSAATPGSPGVPWSVAGIGDFDGDGKSDILWLNTATGQYVVWLMSGTSIRQSGSPGSAGFPSAPWSVQQVGDFDGDGHADILFYNNTTSQIVIWFMNTDGLTIKNAGSPGTPGLAWQVQTPPPFACTTSVYCNLLAGMNNTRINGSFGPGNPAPSSTAGGPLNPFIWSPAAATIAQTYAATCPGLNHNANRGPFGENIFIQGAECFSANNCIAPVTVTGTDAAQSWASEAANYSYNSNSSTNGQETGHYTQVVWRGTTAVGCGVAQCSVNSPLPGDPNYAIEICDFAPPGNDGSKPY